MIWRAQSQAQPLARRLAGAYLRIAVMACATHAALLVVDRWQGGQNVVVLGSALVVSGVTALLVAWGRVPLPVLSGALSFALPLWLLGVVGGSAVLTGSVPAAYFLTLAIVAAVLRATLPGGVAARVNVALVLATGVLVLGWAPAQTPLLIYAAFLTALIGFLAEHGVTLHAERRHSDALQTLAVTDVLTGVLNRRGGEVVLAELLADASVPVAALLLDIDRFKGINDRFGHAAGDEVLLGVARAAQRAAGEDVTVIRWGGEEFLLVWRCGGPSGARVVAERVVQAVRAVRVPAAEGAVVTVSAGLAFSTEVNGLEGLLRRADQRMYAAKQAGGDGWQSGAPV